MLSETCTAWQTDLKRHNRRNVLDKPGNLEDHVGGVSVLLDGAVDLITSGILIKLSAIDRAKYFFTFSWRFRLCTSVTRLLGTNELRRLNA